MMTDHSTQTVGAATCGGQGRVEPAGHLQPGQGEANPGADLAGEGKVMSEPLEVDTKCVREIGHLHQSKNVSHFVNQRI